MSDPIPVPIGVCPCPGSPHGDGDTVYLRPKLGFEGGIAVEAAMTSSDDAQGQTLAVSMALVQFNIVDWTFVAADGQPVPVPNVPIPKDFLDQLLPYAEGGELVANKAAGLYLEAVYGPLAARVKLRSPSSPHNGATRPLLSGRQPSRRKRSASSSRAGSAGAR